MADDTSLLEHAHQLIADIAAIEAHTLLAQAELLSAAEHASLAATFDVAAAAAASFGRGTHGADVGAGLHATAEAFAATASHLASEASHHASNAAHHLTGTGEHDPHHPHNP